jgi:quaternary ammonium compound-resistance protein SugE
VAWLVLVSSGAFEAVWAIALGKSHGLTRLTPSLVFIVAGLLSMSGLAYAMKTLPTATSYVVWVGIGAALTFTYAVLTGVEPISVTKVVLVVGIVTCVIGLKVLT